MEIVAEDYKTLILMPKPEPGMLAIISHEVVSEFFRNSYSERVLRFIEYFSSGNEIDKNGRIDKSVLFYKMVMKIDRLNKESQDTEFTSLILAFSIVDFKYSLYLFLLLSNKIGLYRMVDLMMGFASKNESPFNLILLNLLDVYTSDFVMSS